MSYPDETPPKPTWRDNPVYVREFFDAVAEGRQGFRLGKSNPHPAGTREHNAWWLGWEEERSFSTSEAFRQFIHGARP